jgi:hypothetical protein
MTSINSVIYQVVTWYQPVDKIEGRQAFSWLRIVEYRNLSAFISKIGGEEVKGGDFRCSSAKIKRFGTRFRW